MEGGLSHLPAAAGALDWSKPWYLPWRGAGAAAARAVAAGAPVWVALAQGEVAGGGACPPLRFVAQARLPAGQAYEQYIFHSRECPSRDNLHDLFNGVVWLGMPRCKSRLNALQAEQIGLQGVGSVRGPVRDAITVFDENGALLDAPQPLWDALLAREWRRLFVDLRPLWAQARVLVFGHALLEKLASPRKDLTAHVWRSPVPLASLEVADRFLAERLDAAGLAAKPFTPLPVLGVPGWSPASENFSYYDDSEVFRPARRNGRRCA